MSSGASGGGISKRVKGKGAWPEGYGRRVYDTLDSTLSEAGRLAADLTEPTWILAQEQTAARGRRGRSWSTPRGNFAATLVMQPGGTPGQAALRTFVASLALHRTLVALTGRNDLSALKWPNDVLLGGGKVAGILLENVGPHLAVGIGVNLLHAPGVDTVEPGALTPVSVVGETGITVAPDDFLDVLAGEFAPLEAQLRGGGFGSIRESWLSHAARLGERITARTMRDETTGLFEDIDETGALILRTAKGRVAITAADVFF